MILIKKYREVARITQQQLADLLEVSRQTIVRFENGTYEPRSSELKKMSEIFGCTIDDLVNPTLTPAGSQAQQGTQ